MLRSSATSWALLFTLLLLPAVRVAGAQVMAEGILPPATLSGTIGVMPPFKFDIISFKPCGADSPAGPIRPEYGGDFFAYHCQTVHEMIYYAYDVPQHPFLLNGEPDWAKTDLYEFVAKVAAENADAFQKLDEPSKRMMVRGVLVDELNLKLHADLTPHQVYDLMVGKGELKMTPFKKDETNTLPNGQTMVGKTQARFGPEGTVYYQGQSMAQFAEAVETRIGKQVINKTGLAGQWDFTTYMPAQHYSPNNPNMDDSAIPHVFDGVKALGLNLVSAKEVTGALVLDHVDRPPQN